MVEPRTSDLKSNNMISKAMQLTKTPLANAFPLATETQGT